MKDNFQSLGPITHYTLEEGGNWYPLHYSLNHHCLDEVFALKFIDGSIWEAKLGWKRCN